MIYPAPTCSERKLVYEQPGPYPPAGGGGSAIALTLKYMPLAFLFGLFKPVVEINGQAAGVRAWGRQVIPVPPGQYHLHVHVPYLLPSKIGNADVPLSVGPGQTAELEYRAPTIAFLNGALGAQPQKYPGIVASYILMAVSLVILLCVCGGIVVGALSHNGN